MRMIDADILVQDTIQEYARSKQYRDAIIRMVNKAPTIDIEPKRGEWKIEVAETIYGKAYLLTCSECGETVSVTETALPYEHFCRNCGASMREREGE